MLQLRPTFSESWYRVAKLRARLRSSAQISRQFYRGERWYVVRDPAGNQYHRLSDSAYRFIGLLDGRRTVAEAWDLAGGQLADDAPTQPEVIQILSHLYSANLIESDVTPDAKVLLRRQKQLNKRKIQGRLMNVLFPRIPLWDPDQFLVRWLPVMRKVFSKTGAIVWLIGVISAIVWIAPLWPELKTAATKAVDLHSNPENAFYLWLVFVFVKLIHELGHAFACRRFGGECHELGIMFLVFIPTPYVDASSAWAFSNRWQRIFVGAAGMIVELFFASLCAFLWYATRDSQYTLIPQLAYNAMLIASVTTLIFNANPLLRYDGYYILSDWLEIPNLRQKSSEYALGLIKRHVFRVKLQQPLPPIVQRIWLLAYAVFSSIYRLMVGFFIIMMVAFQIPILGAIMALGGVITWALVPISKLSKYLMIEPELHRKRGRATAFCAAVAALAIVLFGLIQFPVRVRAEGIIEPDQKQVVHAGVNGFVTEIHVKDGQAVKAGDLLLVLQDKELETTLNQLNAKLLEMRTRMQQSSVLDQAQRQIYEIEIDGLNEQLAEALRRKGELEIRAPIDGAVIAPKLDEFSGRWCARGTDLLTIATTNRQVAKLTIDQGEYQLLTKVETPEKTIPANKVEITIAGQPDPTHSLPVLAARALASAQDELPHESLGQVGGGLAHTDTRDPKGRRAVVPQFEVRVKLDNPNNTVMSGQRAYARFTVESESLLWQGYRRLAQLIQAQAANASELTK